MPVNAPPATPPVVPIRRSGWPARRISVPVLLAAVVLAAGVALVSIAHKPSTAQRTSDLNAFMHDMNTAVESCAGGVRESLSAMKAVEAGSGQVAAASKLIAYNASNCSPANSQPLADLTQYQVSESLASFNLKTCVSDFVTWAFPYAMQAQQDMGTVVAARTAAGRAQATAALARATGKLDAERAAIYAILAKAEKSLSDSAAPPDLPR
jgi:hypothetical protein